MKVMAGSKILFRQGYLEIKLLTESWIRYKYPYQHKILPAYNSFSIRGLAQKYQKHANIQFCVLKSPNITDFILVEI